MPNVPSPACAITGARMTKAANARRPTRRIISIVPAANSGECGFLWLMKRKRSAKAARDGCGAATDRATAPRSHSNVCVRQAALIKELSK